MSINDNIIHQVILFCFTFLGAFILYILNKSKDNETFSLFKAVSIDVSSDEAKPHIIFLDIILSSLLGSLAIMAITVPETIPQAITSGLGMTGILSVKSTSN